MRARLERGNVDAIYIQHKRSYNKAAMDQRSVLLDERKNVHLSKLFRVPNQDCVTVFA